MRIKDALTAVFRKSARGRLRPLTTIWTEQADDGKEIPLPEYPRPQMRRDHWICLNGWWEYAFTGLDEIPREAEGRILVPFSPETRRSSAERTLKPEEALWYRRKVWIPEFPAESRLLLHFGAVDERCTVWVNGCRIGSHRGGYLPFQFDVTREIKIGENEISVRVRDETDRGLACRGKQKLSPGGMFYTAQSGIWQTVWMEWVPDNSITGLKIIPHLSEQEVEFCISMSRPVSGEIGVGKGRIFTSEEVTLADTDHTLKIHPVDEKDFDRENRLICRIKLEKISPWSPETPVLYPVRIRMGQDRIVTYFAMRSFGRGYDPNGHACLTLNEQPYFFHGILDQGYWPESLMTAPSDESMIFDINEMKQVGFNMLRKHAKIEPLRWYYHCDRIGMVVWQDMVNGGGPIPSMLCTYLPTLIPALGKMVADRYYKLLSRENSRERKRFEQQLIGMIDHLANEPCIGMWVIFNEGWGQFDSVRLTEAVRRKDPSRPIDHASGWFDQGAGDVCSVHNYFRELKVEKDRYNRPFVISEYGGLASRISDHITADGTYGYHDVAPEKFPDEFRTLMEKISDLGKNGLAGAVYTQVSDIEEEINGLLTYDRKIKKSGRIDLDISNKIS